MTSNPEQYFMNLIESVPGAFKGKMFGVPCIKVKSGKVAAVFWNDDLVVKLPSEALTEALSWDGSKSFEPMKGKTMKEWAQVSVDYLDKWKELVEVAVKYVGNLSVE